MATPITTQTEFYAMVNGNLHGKFAQVQDRQVTSNRAVRYVLGDMDLRSTKRSAVLSPNIFTDMHEYAAPTDLKGEKLIDLRTQINRKSYEKWLLVDDDEFDRGKDKWGQWSNYRVSVRDENFGKLLRIDGL